MALINDDMIRPEWRFLLEVENELARARAKFPGPNVNLAALTEEVGELAKALLHIREGKATGWAAVYAEAVQVATMAARVALEGDPSIAVPGDDD